MCREKVYDGDIAQPDFVVEPTYAGIRLPLVCVGFPLIGTRFPWTRRNDMVIDQS